MLKICSANNGERFNTFKVFPNLTGNDSPQLHMIAIKIYIASESEENIFQSAQ